MKEICDYVVSIYATPGSANGGQMCVLIGRHAEHHMMDLKQNFSLAVSYKSLQPLKPCECQKHRVDREKTPSHPCITSPSTHLASFKP